jgi:hypothetical protein
MHQNETNKQIKSNVVLLQVRFLYLRLLRLQLHEKRDSEKYYLLIFWIRMGMIKNCRKKHWKKNVTNSNKKYRNNLIEQEITTST